MSRDLGEPQLAVMEIVWERGSGTVAEIHEQLAPERSLAYTTVLSTMRGLEKRGLLLHRAEGKAHRFFPTQSRTEYTRTSVSDLVDRLFAGRPERLLTHLLGEGEWSPGDVEAIRRRIDETEIPDEEDARDRDGEARR